MEHLFVLIECLVLLWGKPPTGHKGNSRYLGQNTGKLSCLVKKSTVESRLNETLHIFGELFYDLGDDEIGTESVL